MRRCGFTLVELSIAMAISTFLLLTFGGLLTSFWIMAKESTDELQCIGHADFLRNKFFHTLTDDKGELWRWKDKEKDDSDQNVGLLWAKSILFSSDGGSPQIIADLPEGTDQWSVDLSKNSAVEFFGLDASKCKSSDYRQPKKDDNGVTINPSVQYIYLKFPIGGKTVYYDVLRIPSIEAITSGGSSPKESLDIDDLKEMFGGK